MAWLATVRFLLELCAVAALAVAGARIGWWATIALPAFLVLVWAGLIAPKARRRLPDPARLAVELVLFAGVGLALGLAGHQVAGGALAVASAAVAVAVRATRTPV